MPLSPQRRRAPLPSFLRRQEPSLANADQTLTGVDTRLPKLDTVNPCPTPNPSKTPRNRSRARHPDISSVNFRCQPLRHTPNKPEQIRTNPNTAERSDQIGRHPGSPPIPRKKQTLNTVAATLRHSCAGRNPGDRQRLVRTSTPDGPSKPPLRRRALGVKARAAYRVGSLPAQE